MRADQTLSCISLQLNELQGHFSSSSSCCLRMARGFEFTSFPLPRRLDRRLRNRYRRRTPTRQNPLRPARLLPQRSGFVLRPRPLAAAVPAPLPAPVANQQPPASVGELPSAQFAIWTGRSHPALLRRLDRSPAALQVAPALPTAARYLITLDGSRSAPSPSTASRSRGITSYHMTSCRRIVHPDKPPASSSATVTPTAPLPQAGS